MDGVSLLNLRIEHSRFLLQFFSGRDQGAMTYNWLAQFSATWDMLVSVRLPAPLRGLPKGMLDEEPQQGLPELARPLFPVVGAVLGLCAFLPAWFLIRVPGNPAAALVCGIAIPAMLEFMTGGRLLAALASYLESRWHGATHGEAVAKAPETGFNEAKSPSGMILILSVYMLRAVSIGILVACSHPSWFIVAFAGSRAVQAHLASLPAPSGGVPLIEAPDSFYNHHWYFAAIVMLLGGIAELPASLIALALCWILAKWIGNICLSKLGCVNSRALMVAGAAVECLLLLLGVLLLS
jgi:hypothetical protein